jgi:hypothetical protein
MVKIFINIMIKIIEIKIIIIFVLLHYSNAEYNLDNKQLQLKLFNNDNHMKDNGSNTKILLTMLILLVLMII